MNSAFKRSTTKKVRTNQDEDERIIEEDEDFLIQQESFVGKIFRLTSNYIVKPFLIGTAGAFGINFGMF